MTDSIIKEFEEIVYNMPDNIALLSESEGEMTYMQLDQYANYIAKCIYGNFPDGKRIGVCIDRSFLLIAAILGVYKAGCAYVPLDPAYPLDRLEYYIVEAKVDCVLVSTDNAGKFANEIILQQKVKYEVKSIIYKESSLAYILFTSGSTGVPKGVLVNHDAILNTLKWRIKYYGLISKDVVIQIPSFSYSSSIEDIFSTLLSGGKLLIIKSSQLLNPKKIVYLIRKFQITHFLMIPSLYKEIMKNMKSDDENKLRFVVVAGENLDSTTIDRHFSVVPNARLYNEYGMTETCVGCMVAQITNSNQAGYIGNLIPNMKKIINCLDNEIYGELLIGGKGLAEGYTDGKNLRFVTINGERYFCTGDYVKQKEEGIYYVGRKDSQIKINGQRVDLSEIEEIGNNYVKGVDIKAVGFKFSGRTAICCFVSGKKESDIFLVKSEIEKRLPSFYMPQRFMYMGVFPRLPNGKIDVVKLKELLRDEN